MKLATIIVTPRGEVQAEARFDCPSCDLHGRVWATYNFAHKYVEVHGSAEDGRGFLVPWREALARCESAQAALADVVAAKPAVADAARRHAALKQETLERRIAEQRALLDECEKYGVRTFVRFGKPPSQGYSMDYRDRVPLAGVSCYAGWRLPKGRYVLDLRNVDQASALFLIGTRPVYELSGQFVGVGTDGEPLLKVDSYRRVRGKIEYLWQT